MIIVIFIGHISSNPRLPRKKTPNVLSNNRVLEGYTSQWKQLFVSFVLLTVFKDKVCDIFSHFHAFELVVLSDKTNNRKYRSLTQYSKVQTVEGV